MGCRAAKNLETLALGSGQLSQQAALEQKEASPGSPVALCASSQGTEQYGISKFFFKRNQKFCQG